MITFHRGIVGLAAAFAVAASGTIACESTIDEGDGSGVNTGGSSGSGSGGSGGGSTTLECQPTDPICYGSRPADSPGSECMATIDNSLPATRVQLRQTWTRVVAPVGNTTANVYSILKGRAQFKLPECYMNGDGGYIQLTDWDRSNPDKTLQTIRTGYASYSRQPSSSAPEFQAAALINDGLCMVEWDYTFTSPTPIPAVPDTDLVRWQDAAIAEVNRALPQPWHVEPVIAHRVVDDFPDIAALRGTVSAGDGRIFIDDVKGYLHSYVPLAYVSVLDNRSGGLAVPIREVEVFSQFNDGTFNCIGRFRADKMNLAQNCDSPDPLNSPWGCLDDNACPPAGVGDRTAAGLAPSYTRGYFLIIDLERVWASTLSATLCITYPGEQTSAAEGWSGTWGKNCRGSPKWDPTLPDDAGLPMGDWCSKTNGPATATCHDAYLSESYSTGQAFKVKDVTCPLL